MFSVPSQPGENRGERLEEFESRSVKTRDAVEGFHLLKNSHKLCQGFQQAMDARTTCFISFIKLLFSLLINRKTIYEARTVNSHNSEAGKPHCSRHFRDSQRYENTLVNQSKCTYYPNYFINSNIKLHVYDQIKSILKINHTTHLSPDLNPVLVDN